MLLMPLVGFMLSRFDPRKMMTFGLLALSFSLFHMTGFDLGVISVRSCSPECCRPWVWPSCSSHQYRRLCVSAQGEKQRGLGVDEPCPGI